MSRQSLEGRFPALDGLRALGALAVLTTHVGFQSGDALQGPFAGLLARLDAGVSIFFVISGFLLFRPYAVAHLAGQQWPDVRLYLRHRAIRILPVLWLTVAGAWLLLPTKGATWGDYLRHAFMVHIYSSDRTLAGLTQMWSLATEVAFYLLLPVAAWLLTRKHKGTRWVVSAAGLCVLLFLAGPLWMGVCTAIDRPIGRLWLPGYMGWFAAGMALAVWNAARTSGVLEESRIEEVLRHPGTVWALAAALFVLLSTPIAGPLDLSAPGVATIVTKNALYGLLGLLVVVPAVTPGAAEESGLRYLSGRLGKYLGSISYGVFAYHLVALGLLERAFKLQPFSGQFGIRFASTLAVSTFVATLSFYLLERPLMRKSRSHEQPKAPTFEVGATEVIGSDPPLPPAARSLG